MVPLGNFRYRLIPKSLLQSLLHCQTHIFAFLQNKTYSLISVLPISLVFGVVLFRCVFTFWVSCCDVRYDFRLETMFSSSLPPVVCMRDHVLFVGGIMSCLCCVVFVFACVQWCPTRVVLCCVCICVCLRVVVSDACCVVFICV